MDLRVDFLEEVTPELGLTGQELIMEKSRGRTAQAEAQVNIECYKFPEV